ncbi:PfkB family carbohydrate kinase [Helcobacillus massiliensis]|uniref:argininosuccinate lyase n=1 Tax=Helcobacillus massiliensis TaxID=521392 RepID=A0A839QTF7_9MICO|nr:argininosuccinate lyase [Helcobacillus massiliensis]
MTSTNHSAPLRDRDDLSIYWDNHLRVAFEEAAPHDLPAMVEASIAHVVMLGETEALPSDRASRLIRGLLRLWESWAPTSSDWRPRVRSFPFDGAVEDPYYFLESELAAACDMATADLDVQLARSRNDLDAGVFRMVLRRGVLDIADILLRAVQELSDAAERNLRSLIIGHTHRRPAQPTTIAHVLSGAAEALLSQAHELLSVYDELNVSPLTSAAFAGTDIAVDSQRISDLLGFDRPFTSSYEAVAGAEHFMRVAAIQARISATGARWARVVQEWMNLGWIETPGSFSQGSSIMPQKQNPVVLEHMVSMAGAANGDLVSVYSAIAAGWYEDSNNATTDVQKHLWASVERTVRFLRLFAGVVREIRPLRLPSSAQIVSSGATTTAVAEALAVHGVPWRAAHDVVGSLFRAGEPATWHSQQVEAALRSASIEDSDGTLASIVMSSGNEPEKILARDQDGSPGEAAQKRTINGVRQRCREIQQSFGDRRQHIDDARCDLMTLARERGGRAPRTRISVIGNLNPDVVIHGRADFPAPGEEEVVPEIDLRIGGSAANTALRSAQLGVPTTLTAPVGSDPGADLLRGLAQEEGLELNLVTVNGCTPITVAAEAAHRDRSFISSLGALAEFGPEDVDDQALSAGCLLLSGYFLLPHLQGKRLAALLERAQQLGAITALDMGHPAGGWSERHRVGLFEHVFPHLDILLPNESEVLGLTGAATARDALDRFADAHPMVITKMGEQGALVQSGPRGQRRVTSVPAPRVSPVDTVGAGDAFNAVFLTEFMRHKDPEEAARTAVSTTSRAISLPSSLRDDVFRKHRTDRGNDSV